MKKEKAPKPMTKKKYMSRFSRSARWRLGASEAEEAIRDYREMVYQEGRDEAKLVEELGDPVQAAWLLTEAKEYKRWIKVFAILAFGLLLMVKWAWTGMTFVRVDWDYSMYSEGWRGIAVMAVGLVLSLVWFQRQGQKSGPLSWRLLLSLAVVLILGLAVIGLTWQQLDPDFLKRYSELNHNYEQIVGTSLYWRIILYRELIIDGGTFCPMIALAGLILARCRDRRWLALYTLALTVAALCIIIGFWTRALDISSAAMDDARVYLFPKLIPAGIVGLLGTGVALC